MGGQNHLNQIKTKQFTKKSLIVYRQTFSLHGLLYFYFSSISAKKVYGKEVKMDSRFRVHMGSQNHLNQIKTKQFTKKVAHCL